MIKLKELLSEGKWKAKGKYLYMPTGQMSSIPGLYDTDAVLVTIGRDTFNVYYGKGKEIIAIGSKYDKKFKNANDLVKWLNKEKAKYLGIDRR